MSSEIIEAQHELHGLISRAVENLKKKGSQKLSKGAIKPRLEQLEKNWTKFDQNHEKVAALKKTTDYKTDPYFTEEVYNKAEEAYYENKTEFLDMLADLEDTLSLNSSRHEGASGHQRALPKINLPTFNGKYSEWTSFRDLFRSLVGDNSQLAAVEKLHYLKGCVSGDAAKALANIPVTEENFDRAWEKLQAKFENKRALINTQLDALFALKPIQRKGARDLEHLRSTVAAVLEALAALGARTDKWDYFVVYFVCNRLDPETHEAWELSLGNSTDPPSYEELDDFLESRIRAFETIDARGQGARHPTASGTKSHGASASRPPARSTPARVHANTTPPRAHGASGTGARTQPTATPSPSCPLCDADHYVALCPQYRTKSPEQRREIIVTKRLCFNCLGLHKSRECRSTRKCMVCDQAHHTSIHPSSSTLAPSSGVRPSGGDSRESTSGSETSTSSQQTAPSILHATGAAFQQDNLPQVLLATAIVKAVAADGRAMDARALIDQGSEISFVSESLAQALRLPRHNCKVPLFGIGAQTHTSTRGVVKLKFQNRCDPNIEYDIDAHILSKVTGRVPASPVTTQSWAHLNGLQLADPSFGTPAPVDVLLGADIYGHLLTEDIRKASRNSPVAQRTTLGWIVSGATTSQSADGTRSLRGHCGALDVDLHNAVSRFWEQETVRTPEGGRLTEEERKCEAHFQETHSRDSSGRYTVRLPFKSKLIGHEDSKQIALQMLLRMRKRFIKDPAFQQLYSAFLREYEDLGHMQRIPADRPDCYYLPHHGVLRESSSSTKLRVVFNGSQRVSCGTSLNEALLPGPKLQQDLMDVLMRWRLHPFVFACDVEKMYRQVMVHPDDRKHQCILWMEDPSTSREVATYQLSTVTYGLSCAPYLALRVLLQLAEDEGGRFPLAADVIKQHSYVDDLLGGADTVQLAEEKARQVDQLLKAGGFTLKKWVANEDDVLKAIEAERHLPISKTFDDQEVLRALGLRWNHQTDAFVFSFNKEVVAVTSCTKRTILSVVARLYDPLGWLAPIVVVAKILLQSLWRMDLGWDTPVPDSVASRWTAFAEALSETTSFSIPRWMGTLQSSSVEIHGFSDASRAALAAVVYIRVVEDDFCAQVKLLTSKTRVAPLKNVPIARLELSAAVLLAQLVAWVRQSLSFQKAPVHLWSDSSVALYWIQGEPSRWKEFVGNRVSHIKEALPDGRWRHVAGPENPADAASRGLLPRQLAEHPSWWTGPKWLQHPSTSWPSFTPSLPADVQLEEKPRAVLATASTPSMWLLVTRYSKVETLLGVTARLLDSVTRFRGQQSRVENVKIIPPALLDAAMSFWINETQKAYFPAELSALRGGNPVARTSPLVRLTPFLDSEGLMRVGGRLQRSSLDLDFKHPYILPRSSPFSALLIEQAHRKTYHGGTQLTLSTLRQRFWIIGGRSPVRSWILKCIPCTRQRGKLMQQQMGQLPSLRTSPARPFLHTGVDYAGPYTLKAWAGRSPKLYKAYLVVFICFTTSAVHLELATDYSTTGFLTAFRRFTGRRGLCASITSDNGTNFVGADAELRRMFTDASEDFIHLRSLLAADRVEWRFSPPSAPHFGGKWEAAVKSTKHHLRRVVGDTILTYEEFSAFLSQIEAILNSRPLCPLSDDPSDLVALTPGHFLIGEPLTAFPEPSLVHIPSSRISMFQKSRQMVEHFWRRWSREYLQRFQTTSKWLLPESNLVVGSLVLVADERYPPTKWPLARVVATHPGADGLVRVASVRNATGTVWKRPVTKLCLLPVQ